MTNEEAVSLLDNLIGFVEDSQSNDYDSALKKAIKAIKNEGEFRWHDLRKNPRDTPKEGTHIAYVFKSPAGVKCLSANVCSGWLSYSIKYQANPFGEYVAWKEIEPFEEEMK